MVDQVEHRAGERERRGQRQPQDHVADLADDVEGQDAPHFHLGCGAEHADQHGGARHPQQHLVGDARVPVGQLDFAKVLPRINAGDTIWFDTTMPGFHTITFLTGAELPPLYLPESTPPARGEYGIELTCGR